MAKLSRIVARKHNGETAKVFHGLTPVVSNDEMIVLYSDAGARVDEVQKNDHWITHYAAYKILLLNEHYNFVIVEKENGNEYYCNLASPPVIDGDTVSYIDYDIDVILSPEGEVTVHDLDQFDERIIEWNYPSDLVMLLRQKQAAIETDLTERNGYFANSFYRYLAALLICLPDDE